MFPIPVYVGRRFMTSLEDAIWQPTECEHCHIEWAFRVRLSGFGEGESPFMLDDEGASKRAAERARASLEEDRRTAAGGVTRNLPCPGCGWYQAAMVTRMRAAHASVWGAVGAVCIAIGSMLALRGLTDGEIGTLGGAWILSGTIPLAGGMASLAWRKRLQRRFDPNAALAPNPPGSTYRGRGTPALAGNGAVTGPLEAITREQYEAACAEAAAQGSSPARTIQWRRA